jgi:DNA-binding transcriptional LysR family regulator
VLTDAGRALARSATDVAVSLAKATALWDEFRNHAVGEVSLVTFPTAGQMLLPGVIKHLRPDLVLNCADEDPELSDFPAFTAEYDIVLAHSMSGQLSWAGRGLKVVPLMTEPLDVGLPVGHPLADRAWVRPSDLIGETWIGVTDGYPFERILHAIEQEAGARLSMSQRFADLALIESFVIAGLGIALVPRYTSGGGQPGRLVLKPLRGIESERQIVALMRPDRAERLAVRTVIEALQSEAQRVQQSHTAH